MHALLFPESDTVSVGSGTSRTNPFCGDRGLEEGHTSLGSTHGYNGLSATESSQGENLQGEDTTSEHSYSSRSEGQSLAVLYY